MSLSHHDMELKKETNSHSGLLLVIYTTLNNVVEGDIGGTEGENGDA